MAKDDITTTVTHVQIMAPDRLRALFTSNDIRDNYASELCDIDLASPATRQTLLARSEWLTSFHSPAPDTSYVSRWDDRVYRIEGAEATAIDRPCEAITRVAPGSGSDILCTCYWGLVQLERGGAWTSLDMKREVDLFGALGDRDGAFYVCGAEGLLARHDGSAWRVFDLPTDVDFFGLAWHEDGELVICGDGLILKGQGEEWAALDAPEVTYHFAKRSDDGIYLAGGDDGLFLLKGDAVDLVSDEVFAYHCDAVGGAVACCGANRVHVFRDGGRMDIEFEDLL